VFAKLTPGINTDKAFLAGLLHNIGAIVILNNLSDKLNELVEENQIFPVLFKLQSEIGANLLTKWEFDEELVTAIENTGNWERNASESADLADIINISMVHTFIGTDYQEFLPNVDDLLAFSKVASGNLTPELSMQILEHSQAEIDETIQLFS